MPLAEIATTLFQLVFNKLMITPGFALQLNHHLFCWFSEQWKQAWNIHHKRPAFPSKAQENGEQRGITPGHECFCALDSLCGSENDILSLSAHNSLFLSRVHTRIVCTPLTEVERSFAEHFMPIKNQSGIWLLWGNRLGLPINNRHILQKLTNSLPITEAQVAQHSAFAYSFLRDYQNYADFPLSPLSVHSTSCSENRKEGFMMWHRPKSFLLVPHSHISFLRERTWLIAAALLSWDTFSAPPQTKFCCGKSIWASRRLHNSHSWYLSSAFIFSLWW